MYVNEGKCMKARNPTVQNIIETLANMRKQVSIGMSKYGLPSRPDFNNQLGWLATTSLGHTLYSTKTLAINTDNLIFCIYTYMNKLIELGIQATHMFCGNT